MIAQAKQRSAVFALLTPEHARRQNRREPSAGSGGLFDRKREEHQLAAPFEVKDDRIARLQLIERGA